MLSIRLLVLCTLVNLNIGQFLNRGSTRFTNRGMTRSNLSGGGRILTNQYNNRNFFPRDRRFNNQLSNFNNLIHRNQGSFNPNRAMNGQPRMRNRSPRPNYLSAPIVQRLMSFINKYRGEVDATNMYTMKWSNVLANRAAARSRTCMYDNIYDSQGESLITVPADVTGTNMVDYIMKQWYDEKNTFRWEYDCRETNSCRYSQMIWANSREIGCASHWCNREQFVVCLFNNAGNIPRAKAYYPGNHCQQCGGCLRQLCTW